MAATYAVTSSCECQATLGAHLDEKRHVVDAWATTSFGRAHAVAHTLGAQGDRFEVAWHCPCCGRNALRAFYAGSLRRLPTTAA